MNRFMSNLGKLNYIKLKGMAEVYVCESLSVGKTIHHKLGKGLHAMVRLDANSLVGEFNGTVRTVAEFEIRDAEGKGGYAIHLRKGYVLDCYDQYLRGECLMSYSNTARNSYSWKCGRGCGSEVLTLSPNRNNCFASLNGDRVRLWVGSGCIQANSELFWAYGSRYSV
jgi:hypothetical protein